MNGKALLVGDEQIDLGGTFAHCTMSYVRGCQLLRISRFVERSSTCQGFQQQQTTFSNPGENHDMGRACGPVSSVSPFTAVLFCHSRAHYSQLELGWTHAAAWPAASWVQSPSSRTKQVARRHRCCPLHCGIVDERADSARPLQQRDKCLHHAVCTRRGHIYRGKTTMTRSHEEERPKWPPRGQ